VPRWGFSSWFLGRLINFNWLDLCPLGGNLGSLLENDTLNTDVTNTSNERLSSHLLYNFCNVAVFR